MISWLCFCRFGDGPELVSLCLNLSLNHLKTNLTWKQKLWILALQKDENIVLQQPFWWVFTICWEMKSGESKESISTQPPNSLIGGIFKSCLGITRRTLCSSYTDATCAIFSKPSELFTHQHDLSCLSTKYCISYWKYQYKSTWTNQKYQTANTTMRPVIKFGSGCKYRYKNQCGNWKSSGYIDTTTNKVFDSPMQIQI